MASPAYPKELATVAALPSGTPIRLRPIRPEDEPRLIELAARMTPEDLRLRFFAALQGLTHEAAARLVRIDYAHDMALIAQPMHDEEILGVARYAATPDTDEAEFAVAVRSDWKGHGVGWLLMETLVDIARQRGIRALSGLVLRANPTMLQFCRDLGFTIANNPDDPLTVYASLVLG
ncbi:MAG TPA: GNAT family N-acetyltransferase [Stellaceae bacterium]|nr:GNAT family N-acetyltransferase [Stellaceae bacterium]